VSHYFGSLVDRALGIGPQVEPRLPSLYEAKPRGDSGSSAPQEFSSFSAAAEPSVSSTPPTASAARGDLSQQNSRDASRVSESSQPWTAPRDFPRESRAGEAATKPFSEQSSRPTAESHPDDPSLTSSVAPKARPQAAPDSDSHSRGTIRPIVRNPISPSDPFARETQSARPPEVTADRPVVRVTIGRVEVRAVFAKPATPPPAPVAQLAPKLPLEEYLRRRNGPAR